MTSARGYVALGLILASCASVPLPVNVSRYRQSEDMPTMPTPLCSMLQQERDDADGLIKATYEVITSPAFAVNLLATRQFLGQLWLGPGGDRVEQDVVASVFLGQDRNHPLLPATVAWSGPDSNVRGSTNIIASGTKGVIVLDAETRDRWRATSLTKKSCAINTLAHEMTHVVALRPQIDNGQMFVDYGRSWTRYLDRPLASYAVGAVAQCTFIEQRGGPPEDLQECIRKRGVNILEAYACD